ncbi:MAG TPA: hypothetical protein VMJ10_10650 [Kofleriaceae bacterium]|nr:hypothetical protein [Kofleriaceae bacterium]
MFACLAGVVACTAHNPRACPNGDCTNPAYPFCDVDGSLGGTPGECIAVSCTPMQFAECRGSDALTCNATGDNYDSSQCEGTCDPTQGCVTPMPPRVLYIVFTSDRDGNSEIYRMNPDGSMQTNLTSNPASDTSPMWDPTGERIAFLSGRSGTQELYVMAPDGTGVVDVSSGQAQDAAWSPDGTQLAFTSTRSGHPEIYRVAATGGAVSTLTSLGLSTTGNASWSPDGTKLTFGTGEIYVMSSDGTGQSPITQGSPRGDREPMWSPDGAHIAFVRGLTFENADVFVMNADGSQQQDVTVSETTQFEGPVTWDPNSSQLIGEIADGNTGDADFGTGLFSVAPTGSGFQYVVTPSAYRPCWAGDGMTFCFDSDRSGNAEVYSVSGSGGTPDDLTNSGGNDTQCSMRPK